MGKINDYSLLPSITGYENGRLVIETDEGTRTTTPDQIVNPIKEQIGAIADLIGDGGADSAQIKKVLNIVPDESAVTTTSKNLIDTREYSGKAINQMASLLTINFPAAIEKGFEYTVLVLLKDGTFYDKSMVGWRWSSERGYLTYGHYALYGSSYNYNGVDLFFSTSDVGIIDKIMFLKRADAEAILEDTSLADDYNSIYSVKSERLDSIEERLLALESRL